MMNQFPDDDEQLVSFLKQYRPVPPQARADMEAQLMELVTREPPPPPRHPHQFFWLVSSAMAGSLLLAVGSYRWLNPSPQVATNQQELEAFLVDSWNGAIEETSVTSPTTTHTSEADWLLMTEPKARYAVSYP
ncbi:MAG: hypothetical protein IGR93_10815 [Hydrococcus sp. C42_A2020_068]|uniref:hypothetical protein n=1 Tax=Pleurocapsa sp. PCC 7327 TaxID=118163 RepID=UPI00118671C5|nr:hypothetical protein [Pleurocapsa sp. PCC 7327]MBF2020574.1 hypothetical protein [Hydrococcus sp. C42_A2020_068]